MTDFEDEPPCIHHRSQFDTLPAPPDSASDVHVLKDPVYRLTQRGRQTLAGIELPAVLRFEGGDVPLPNPTRADLLLSARQWATAVRESFVDGWLPEFPKAGASMLSKLDRLDAVLAELAAMEEK